MQILREPTLRNCRQQCAKKGTYIQFSTTLGKASEHQQLLQILIDNARRPQLFVRHRRAAKRNASAVSLHVCNKLLSDCSRPPLSDLIRFKSATLLNGIKLD